MRVEYPPLCGRDHLAYRSYYFPVKVLLMTSENQKNDQVLLFSCFIIKS